MGVPVRAGGDHRVFGAAREDPSGPPLTVEDAQAEAALAALETRQE
jgi:hypothetical protein